MSNFRRIPFFAVEVHSGAYIPHRLLFVDDVESVLDHANFPGSHIYYVTRVPKVRFDVARCKLDGGSLRAELNVMPSHRVSIDIALRSIHPLSTFPAELFDEALFTIASAENDSSLLRFIANVHGEKLDFDIPVENLLAGRDVDLGFRPELIYVGQSFEMLKRWQNHKQVNRALSILGDTEELRLYFIHFSFFGSFSMPGDTSFQALLDTRSRDSLEFRDRISVLEQVLIHFYKPALNSQHVDGNVDTAPFTRLISRVQLESVGLSLGMHGHAFDFWSPGQVLNEEVVTLVNMDGLPQFEAGIRDMDHFFG